MLVALLLFLALGGEARGQSVDAESAFGARVAQERQSRGLPPLAGSDDLVAVARRHAQRMADAGEAYHNPNLANEVSGWSLLGENVGEGFGVEEIHRAFMGSQTHRDVILSTQLTQIGVGVVTSEGGHLWVVQVYRRPAQAASSASAPSSSPAPSAPAPSAPSPAPSSPSAEPPAPTPPAPAAGDGGASVLAVTAPGSATVPVAPPLTASPPALAPALSDDGGHNLMRPVRVRLADPVAGIDARELASHVPGATRVAALLLAGVVGMHGVVLRRLGLLS